MIGMKEEERGLEKLFLVLEGKPLFSARIEEFKKRKLAIWAWQTRKR